MKIPKMSPMIWVSRPGACSDGDPSECFGLKDLFGEGSSHEPQPTVCRSRDIEDPSSQFHRLNYPPEDLIFTPFPNRNDDIYRARVPSDMLGSLPEVIAERVALYTQLSREYSNQLAQIVVDEVKEGDQNRRHLEALVRSELLTLREEIDIAITALRERVNKLSETFHIAEERYSVSKHAVASKLEVLRQGQAEIRDISVSLECRLASEEASGATHSLRLGDLEDSVKYLNEGYAGLMQNTRQSQLDRIPVQHVSRRLDELTEKCNVRHSANENTTVHIQATLSRLLDEVDEGRNFAQSSLLDGGRLVQIITAVVDGFDIELQDIRRDIQAFKDEIWRRLSSFD